MEYKETELSQWFDLSVQKPWQEGVYEVMWPQRDSAIQKFKPAIAYWNGEFFGKTGETMGYVTSHRCHEGDITITKWRGLSSDPSPKPKRKGNPQVTRYVVMYDAEPLAVFRTRKECMEYVGRGSIWWTAIKPIRFRTPEAK